LKFHLYEAFILLPAFAPLLYNFFVYFVIRCVLCVQFFPGDKDHKSALPADRLIEELHTIRSVYYSSVIFLSYVNTFIN